MSMLRSPGRRRRPTASVGPARIGSLLAALASSLVIGGCGGAVGRSAPSGESVSGTVTWQGKPLALGSISFVPAADGDLPGNGALITNGRYEIPNPPGLAPGSYRVRIHAKGKTRRNGPVSEPPKGVPDFRPIDPDQPEQIPEKYNDETTLTAEVVPGSNTKNFELTGTRSPARGGVSTRRPPGTGRHPM